MWMHTPDYRIKPAMTTLEMLETFGSPLTVPQLSDHSATIVLVYTPFEFLNRDQTPDECSIPPMTGGPSDMYWMSVLEGQEPQFTVSSISGGLILKQRTSRPILSILLLHQQFFHQLSGSVEVSASHPIHHRYVAQSHVRKRSVT